MNRTKSFSILILLLITTVPVSAQLATDWGFGVRSGIYADRSDPFIGIEAITPITRNLFFNPSVEWVFTDRGDLGTVNADVHLDIALNRDYYVWVGAGLAGIYRDLNETDWELGANGIAGIGWRIEGWLPYAQAKVLISDDHDQFVGAVGLRF